MKKILSVCIIFFSLSLLAFAYYCHLNSNYTNVELKSPLPDFLTIFNNHQVSTTSLWLPSLSSKINSKIKEPDVTAKSALVYDLENKIVLYEKNSEKKLPMASLTKIMTAIIALENPKTDNKYLVKKEYLVGENSMNLTEGELLSIEELMHGLILNSGNDAAETIAGNFKGGRNEFIKAMNDKTKTLGLNNTNFTNPTGLEGDGNQYTTAYDLLVITNYALSNFPLFKKVAATVSYKIDKTFTHKEFYLENETNLLTSYPGVKGVKTGYTYEAGLCLATYLDYDNQKIIGIILNSENRRDEMKELLDYSLKSLNIAPPKHS